MRAAQRSMAVLCVAWRGLSLLGAPGAPAPSLARGPEQGGALLWPGAVPGLGPMRRLGPRYRLGWRRPGAACPPGLVDSGVLACWLGTCCTGAVPSRQGHGGRRGAPLAGLGQAAQAAPASQHAEARPPCAGLCPAPSGAAAGGAERRQPAVPVGRGVGCGRGGRQAPTLGPIAPFLRGGWLAPRCPCPPLCTPGNYGHTSASPSDSPSPEGSTTILSTRPASRNSIVVSIPACHAGGRGSIPRCGDCFSCLPIIHFAAPILLGRPAPCFAGPGGALRRRLLPPAACLQAMEGLK